MIIHSLRVKGRRALFSRPEFSVEFVTYDVMTPSAAVGILESIYWKPEMKWIVDFIHVLNPIKTDTIMGNYVTSKISVKKALGGKDCHIDATENREQRNAVILKDVDYVIKAHINVLSGDHPEKHDIIFKRRAESGQNYRHPYFGQRDFSVDMFELVKDIPSSHLKDKQDLGIMLYGLNWDKKCAPMFFHAVMENGIIAVPQPGSKEILQ